MTTHDITALPDLASRALGGNVQSRCRRVGARSPRFGISLRTQLHLNRAERVRPSCRTAVAAAVREAASKGGESDV
jgi:hypothetical protein